MIKYFRAPDIEERILDIITGLDMDHINPARVVCIRSHGSAARRTIARCHAMPRIMQAALDKPPHYIVEVIAEQFDRQSEEDQTKTLIHELMHIPKAFGGGFKGHSFVNSSNVETMYRKLASKTRDRNRNNFKLNNLETN